MKSSADVSPLLEGIIVGVTIAVILGIAGWIRERYREREQIRHISDVVRKRYRVMLTVADIQDGPRLIPANLQRILLFKELLKQIERALVYRSSHLRYQRMFRIRSILDSVTNVMNELGIGESKGQRPPNGMKFYEQHFFEKLDDLKWLKLAKSDVH